MANTAHLVRRQSSRDLSRQKSIDRLEMRELKGRLVRMESVAKKVKIHMYIVHMYI